MSSTKIYQTKNAFTGETVIKKIIQKEKLINELSKHFAKKECSVHYAMNHPNIVKLFEYVENPTEY
jgi:serine/threonine protein kinase